MFLSPSVIYSFGFEFCFDFVFAFDFDIRFPSSFFFFLFYPFPFPPPPPHPPSNNQPPTSPLPRLTRSLKSPIRQPPHRLRRALPRCNPRDIMTQTLHVGYCTVIVGVFERGRVGLELVVEAGVGEGG